MLKITATLYHTLFVSPTHGTKYSVIVYVYPQVARPIKYIIENDFQFRIGNQRPRFFFFCYLVVPYTKLLHTVLVGTHTVRVAFRLSRNSFPRVVENDFAARAPLLSKTENLATSVCILEICR